MVELLPNWPTLGAFLAASIILAVTPGPAVFYIVTRSLAQGRFSGLACVAGVALGNLGNAFAAALGLAAWLALSSIAFTTIKYVGAGYLIYLGLRTLLSPPAEISEPLVPQADLLQIFRDAFTVALLNPKTTIFFAAFVPPFMGSQSVRENMLLGSIFVVIPIITAK